MGIETFDSLAAWDAAVTEVVALAQQDICCFDPDLKQGALSSSAAVRAFEAFLTGGARRSLKLLLHDSRHLADHCPRLLELHRKRAHQFTVMHTAHEHRSFLQPFVLCDARHLATRFHADHARGKLVIDDGSEVAPLVEISAGLVESSTPASGLAPLGI